MEENSPLAVRRAKPGDAEALRELYLRHLTDSPPEQERSLAEWRSLLADFERDEYYHLLVGETGGRVVSSVTLVIIRNLTHNLRPYAVMENVVTHAGCRGRHYASALIREARGIAERYGCYKIMLMTGSKRDTTLRFYENCGFRRDLKTAFLLKL